MVASDLLSEAEPWLPHVSIPFIAGQWSLLSLDIGLQNRFNVSIPFIAGQWSLPICGKVFRDKVSNVSIPFIAGQWSLLLFVLAITIVVLMFQSPSLRGSGRFL